MSTRRRTETAQPVQGAKVVKLEPLVVNVSSKTNWVFIRIETDDGLAGVGEASLNGWEPLQLAYVQMISGDIVGKRLDELAPWLRVLPNSAGGLVVHSVHSALEQAVTDLRAKQAGVPVYRYLGGARRDAVRVYANINRRTRDRTPEGFARSAKDAVDVGFTAIKIAPFDGFYWEDMGDPESRRRLSVAIDRIYAIREAVGPDIDFMIDCHWRFDEATAAQVMRELAGAKLFWIECPVSENVAHHAALARLRALAAEYGTRLAGAETQVGLAGFKPIVEGKLFDVVMPDMKYAGGYRELMRISDLTAAGGLHVAPHNPTGPVCNLASIHACAVLRNFLILEYQLAESPLYFDLVSGFEPALVDGCFRLPEAPGLGVTIDDDVVRAHPYRPLQAGANLDPRLG